MPLQNKPVDLVHKGIDSIAQFGIPLRRGLVWQHEHIELCLGSEKLISHITPTGFWDDESIRWLQVQALVTKSGSVSLNVNKFSDKVLAISCAETVPTVNDNSLYMHEVLALSVSVELKLTGQVLPLEMTKVQKKVSSNHLIVKHEVSGTFVFEDKKLLLTCIIDESSQTGEINIEARLHNPSAAEHTGGKWDLGDENSVLIDDFSILFTKSNANTTLLLNVPLDELNNTLYDFDHFALSQLGSGGEHWQSPIHWNEHKESTALKQGFELSGDDGQIIEGLRAEPVVLISAENTYLQIALTDFWQNFPIILSSSNESNKWQLMANKTELQGGESKTWQIRCRSGNIKTSEIPSNQLRTDLQAEIKFNAEYINQCMVIPLIALSSTPSRIAKFIELGLEGEQSFFNKRENKDVYGWRNFGELDADHEAVNAPKDTYFISHYNNQYDPLMGMTLQYLHSSNAKWLALVKPLNQHIQDIDIYDTTEDKAEYNGGLMWHTDHYLSAETSTHRSNSKYHEHAYEGFLGGGGPGGQHCYTTGLALQYRLFADESAKNKVEQLCNWIRRFYNGSGSIAERTFRLLTIDIKQNALTNIGIKAPGYKYPLDRGTANYLNALIDCFDITENSKLISEMGDLVRNTFHPNEDIELRDLRNIENAWFYTVFLQAVVRFLLLKETHHAIDEDYWYARHALLHYGKWMLNNERFYLSKADELEFPNDTWCAQDTRKMNLFCYFYYFDSTSTEVYLRKATEYYDYIVEHMETSKETHFARVLALLMQNDGVTQKFGLDEANTIAPRSPIEFEGKDFNEAPTYSRYKLLKVYCKDVTKLLLRFSVKSEWRWLSLRVKSVLNK